MEACLFKDNACFSRLSFVIHTFGNVFLGLHDFTSIVKRFVFGQNAEDPDSTNGEVRSHEDNTSKQAHVK